MKKQQKPMKKQQKPMKQQWKPRKSTRNQGAATETKETNTNQ